MRELSPEDIGKRLGIPTSTAGDPNFNPAAHLVKLVEWRRIAEEQDREQRETREKYMNTRYSNRESRSQRRDTEKPASLNTLERQRMDRRLQRENILRLLRGQGLLLDISDHLVRAV